MNVRTWGLKLDHHRNEAAVDRGSTKHFPEHTLCELTCFPPVRWARHTPLPFPRFD